MRILLVCLTLLMGRLAMADNAAVCFYQDINYQGPYFCQAANMQDYNLSSSGWNRRISSVRILSGVTVTLYSAFNFTGAQLVLNTSQPDLRHSGWNDLAASYRVVAVPAQVCFFQDVNWTGLSFCMAVGTQNLDLRRVGWNDAISSIRVDGAAKAQVFEDINLGGRMVWVTGSVPNMNVFGGGWNDRISSIIVTAQ